MSTEDYIQRNLELQSFFIEEMVKDLDAGFTLVAEHYRKHLIQTAWNVLVEDPRLRHLAEDIVQTGLLSAFLCLRRNPEMLAEDLKLKPWLTTIVQRKAFHCLATGSEHLEITTGVAGVEMEEAIEEGYITHYNDPLILIERLEEKREARNTVRRLLNTLTPDQRAVIERKYLSKDEPTFNDVANDLKMPSSTVKSHDRRGKKRMREQYNQVSEASGIYGVDHDAFETSYEAFREDYG